MGKKEVLHIFTRTLHKSCMSLHAAPLHLSTERKKKKSMTRELLLLLLCMKGSICCGSGGVLEDPSLPEVVDSSAEENQLWVHSSRRKPISACVTLL